MNSNPIIHFIRPDLRDFIPYSSARREASDGKIWLNANESPWANPDQPLNRYPQPQPQQLLTLLAAYYKVRAEQLIVTRGSDEAIDLLVRLVCRPGIDTVITCPPTFGMYAVSTQLQGAHLLTIPLQFDNDFQLDIKAILDACTEQTKLLFLCSPNNPTGQCIAHEDIHQLCTRLTGKTLVVVDEAYIEFATLKSVVSLLDDYANLVVLRTLSKAFGLAAARVGSLLGHPQLIQALNAILAPYPLPSLSVDAACQALSLEAIVAMQTHVHIIQTERSRMQHALEACDCVTKVWPSQGNFLLCQVNSIEKVTQVLQGEGIVVRDMSYHPGLANCLRISMGLPQENNQMIHALQRCEDA